MNKKPNFRGKYRKRNQGRMGEFYLVLREHDDMKMVEIWLTRAEQEDDNLRRQLRNLYQDYSQRKFKVAQFHSGTGPLYDATRDLLLFSRKRLAEMENRSGKSLGDPNLSTSYS